MQLQAWRTMSSRFASMAVESLIWFKLLNGLRIMSAADLVFILRINCFKFSNICLAMIDYLVFGFIFEDSYFVIFVRSLIHNYSPFHLCIFVNWKSGHSQSETCNGAGSFCGVKLRCTNSLYLWLVFCMIVLSLTNMVTWRILLTFLSVQWAKRNSLVGEQREVLRRVFARTLCLRFRGFSYDGIFAEAI